MLTSLRLLSVLALITSCALLTLSSCDKEPTGIVVEVTNESPYDFIEPKLYVEYDGKKTYRDGYEDATLPNLPSGATVSLMLPADSEFGWGNPNPGRIEAEHPEVGSLVAWDGMWCGTGYFTKTVDPGTYRYVIEERRYGEGDEEHVWLAIVAKE